jgi:hypothetical protein
MQHGKGPHRSTNQGVTSLAQLWRGSAASPESRPGGSTRSLQRTARIRRRSVAPRWSGPARSGKGRPGLIGLGPHRINPPVACRLVLGSDRISGGILREASARTSSIDSSALPARPGPGIHRGPGAERQPSAVSALQGLQRRICSAGTAPTGVACAGRPVLTDGLDVPGAMDRLTDRRHRGLHGLREYTDLSRSSKGDSSRHRSDQKETRYIDCSAGGRCRTASSWSMTSSTRTETAMSQEHCFLATELALRAQLKGLANR